MRALTHAHGGVPAGFGLASRLGLTGHLALDVSAIAARALQEDGTPPLAVLTAIVDAKSG